MEGVKWRFFSLVVLIGLGLTLKAQNHLKPGMGNPLIPGYFADPTVKKFGDTYYIYATTDGNGGGFGPSQVWMSKDFVNWTMQDMNWPKTRYYWAPDVTRGNDGRYYMYYCQPVEIFGAVADTPVGPWTSLLPEGKPIVPNFLVPNVITLDGQTFKDDDGKFYMYWGTWGIYPNHGCGVGLLNPDMKSFAKLEQIPNTVAKDFFEAPFMFKRNGIYYLTYSSGRCEDGSYRVQYATSKTGPMGPFVYGKNNPILATNADGSVHGPGHQSVLQDGDNFYMIYHRHNNPHSGGGFHRQVVADKMQFDADGNILKIEPSHKGIGYLAKNENPYPNLALNARIKASSVYSADFKPGYAIDDNNGTLWKPKDNTSAAWLEIDLGKVKTVKSIHTQFEYATWYYQYIIRYSVDGKVWHTYADRQANTRHGSPLIDFGNVNARYFRLNITGTEYPGLNKAVWNIKIFGNDQYKPKVITTAKPINSQVNYKPLGLLVDLNARSLKIGSSINEWINEGKLKGSFSAGQSQAPIVEMIGGKKALVFSGKSYFKSIFQAPESLKGNSSFTVAMWVYNPDIAGEEPVISWTSRGGAELSNVSLGYGRNKQMGAVVHGGWADMAYRQLPREGKWHHIALVFDGTMEKLYVDGVLDKEERKMLFVDRLSEFVIGANVAQHDYFSGALAALKVYDIPLPEKAIKKLARTSLNSKAMFYFDTAKLPYGELDLWKNEGYRPGEILAGKKGAKITDVAGRIALKMEYNEPLTGQPAVTAALTLSKPYTIAAQVFVPAHQNMIFTWPSAAGKLTLKIKGTAKWQQVSCVFDGINYKTYINGVAVKAGVVKSGNSKPLQFSVLNDGIQSAAISSLIVYDYAFTPQAAVIYYRDWVATMPLMQAKAAFDNLPAAISPGMAAMSAASVNMPGKARQYYFMTKDSASGWLNDKQYINFGLSPNSSYSYAVKVRDNFGNISLPSDFEGVNTDTTLFRTYSYGFNSKHDYLQEGTNGTLWTGISGKADEILADSGYLTLSSTHTNWDGAAPSGPFLYQVVSGNFIAETTVQDLSGWKEKKAKGANDIGMMVQANNGSFNLIQNSIMLGWGIGNMVTNLTPRSRPQVNNGAGFNFLRYLQIERKGDVFYLRASNDGKSWQDLPGSPIQRKDMAGIPVRVGLFQATYGEQNGYGAFDDFKIIQLK